MFLMNEFSILSVAAATIVSFVLGGVWFTPRRKRSLWSEKNVKATKRLIKEKLMQPTGLLEIKKAKLENRWFPR